MYQHTVDQNIVDQNIDVLFLQTPQTIFHYLGGRLDEKSLHQLNNEFSKIILEIDSWEETTERKPRIGRIQFMQTVIDKVIESPFFSLFKSE